VLARRNQQPDRERTIPIIKFETRCIYKEKRDMIENFHIMPYSQIVVIYDVMWNYINVSYDIKFHIKRKFICNIIICRKFIVQYYYL